MNRADAMRRVQALRQVTTARGATPNEAAVAQRKAVALQARYGLYEEASAQPSSSRPSPRASAPRTAASPFDRVSPVAFPWAAVPAFKFDVTTGEHSKNVKVHHHNGVGNWKIELFG